MENSEEASVIFEGVEQTSQDMFTADHPSSMTPQVT
jgi:hypothetical protein